MRHLVLSFLFTAFTLVPLFYVTYVKADAAHEAELAAVITAREGLDDTVNRAERRETRRGAPPAPQAVWTTLPLPAEEVKTTDSAAGAQPVSAGGEADERNNSPEAMSDEALPATAGDEEHSGGAATQAAQGSGEEAAQAKDEQHNDPVAESAQLQAFADALSMELFRLMNEEREAAGLPPLVADGALVRMAVAHSEDMAVHQYLAHADGDGCTLRCRLEGADYQASAWAENIAVIHKSDLIETKEVAARIVESWMGSGGHRENILNGDYTHVGIGYAYDGRSVYVTADFALLK